MLRGPTDGLAPAAHPGFRRTVRSPRSTRRTGLGRVVVGGGGALDEGQPHADALADPRGLEDGGDAARAGRFGARIRRGAGRERGRGAMVGGEPMEGGREWELRAAADSPR